MDVEAARATLLLLGFHTGELGTGVPEHPGAKGHIRLDGEYLYMSNAMCAELVHVISRKRATLSWITMEDFLKLWEEYHDLRSV